MGLIPIGIWVRFNRDLGRIAGIWHRDLGETQSGLGETHCEEHGRNAVNRYSINELGDLPLATWLADLV